MTARPFAIATLVATSLADCGAEPIEPVHRWSRVPTAGMVSLEVTRATIVAPRGQKVVAPAPGRVVALRSQPVVYVDIDHGSGLTARYAHLENVVLEVGDQVALNQLIGHVGRGGKESGPHIHIQLFHNGSKVDPGRILPAIPAAKNAP